MKSVRRSDTPIRLCTLFVALLSACGDEAPSADDGGRDAGLGRDGGSTDAASGPDAAGPSADAGAKPDAGGLPEDAGSTDAVSDAGSSDAGSSDAGPSDAGPSDAGPVCVGEVPYDGADNDCVDGDLLDVDGDGYPGIGREAYEALDGEPWPDGLPDELDCDDDDSLVSPGALERLGDATDSDCDGGADTTPFVLGGFEWDEPRSARVDFDGRHYVLAATATGFVGATERAEVGVALPFPIGATSQTDAGATVVWAGSIGAFPLGGGLGLVGDPAGERFYASTSYRRIVSSTENTYLVIRELAWDDTSGRYQQRLAYQNVPEAGRYLDLDMRLDAMGRAWAFASGRDTVHFLLGGEVAGGWTKVASGHLSGVAGGGGDVTWLDVPASGTPVAYTRDTASPDADPRAWVLTESPATIAEDTESIRWDGVSAIASSSREEWTVLALGEEGLRLDDGSTSLTLFGTRGALAGDVSEAPDGTLYAIAIVPDGDADGLDDVVLSYGDPAGTMASLELPFVNRTHPDANPVAASVFVDEQRVFVAVTARSPNRPEGPSWDWSGAGDYTPDYDDAVGWFFLGFPP